MVKPSPLVLRRGRGLTTVEGIIPTSRAQREYNGIYQPFLFLRWPRNPSAALIAILLIWRHARPTGGDLMIRVFGLHLTRLCFLLIVLSSSSAHSQQAIKSDLS